MILSLFWCECDYWMLLMFNRMATQRCILLPRRTRLKLLHTCLIMALEWMLSPRQVSVVTCL